MSEPRADPESRAEQAFRQAVAELDTVGEVDPRAARRHVQRRRGASLLVAIVVVLAGAVTLPQLVSSDSRQGPVAVQAPGSGPSAASAGQPGEWRTERYRNITFAVPAGWGYAYENGDDCAPHTQQQGYVSLGRPRFSDLVGCAKSDGTAILDEHVAVQTALGVEPKVGTGSQHTDGWWVVTRVVDDLLVRAVSRDQALAQRIVGSVARVSPSTDPLCSAHSVLEIQPDARPAEPFDVTQLRSVDSITLCQYDTPGISGPVTSNGPASPGDPAKPRSSAASVGKADTGLSGQATLSGSSASTLLERIQQSAPSEAGTCVRTPGPQQADLVVVLRLQTGSERHSMYVNVQGCTDAQHRAVGGFDDGITLRELSPTACQAMLVPPIRLESALDGTSATSCHG